VIQIFLTFFKLGITSFGGPVAHLGFFHHEFVARKKWISEHEYADLVALCQILPGPASSQVGMAIGFYRGGFLGSLVAWLAFTLPSALLLVLFALSITSISENFGIGWLHGLKIAAVAVVAHAVWEMAKKFCSTLGKALIAIFATLAMIYFQGVWGQILLIFTGGIVGLIFLKPAGVFPHQPKEMKFNEKLSFNLLLLFLIFLGVLPFVASNFDSINMKLASIFYQVGALVFGGGHVVLPLLQSSLVDSGLITKDAFIAGYGAAQAIPGPLFSFAAYLGFVCNSYGGAIISLMMIFLPSFLLVIGIIPYWEKLRLNAKMKSALLGVNAVVVGLLLSALYNPVWTSAIFGLKDFLLAAVAFFLLLFKKAPSYIIVVVLALITANFF
jgi:chromate transporter